MESHGNIVKQGTGVKDQGTGNRDQGPGSLLKGLVSVGLEKGHDFSRALQRNKNASSTKQKSGEKALA
jgi:hypothetical protein